MRNSKSRRRGSLFPLYWSAYYNCWLHQNAMPEERWKANIDWVAENLQPYGYSMITTDGWVKDADITNEYGYSLKYSIDWEHGWQYWADYIRSKGMIPGIYYNVHEVSDTAAKQGKKVIGTDIPISEIQSSTWADPTKAGAKEYVQGYVKHFKDMGYEYIRIDFLSWYETGSDNPQIEVTHFGHDAYVHLLEWVHEAAGEDMEVSWVMNNSVNHAEAERTYGDLVRIANDSGYGGWRSLNQGGQNDLRQTWHDGWPQWANVFQGFTGFSDISGRGNICLDGDWITFNTFSGDYDDNEKKVIISLFTMAGSPLASSDEYDGVGMPENLKYYINPEILALKKEGFCGKPYYYSGKAFEPLEVGAPDTGSRDSERWLGQTVNGDWVVALFNRTDGKAAKSISLKKDLGLQYGGTAKDLWEGTTINLDDVLSAELEPHAVKIVRIVPGRIDKSVVRYAAQVGAYQGGVYYDNLLSGTAKGYVSGFSEENKDAGILFSVGVEAAGAYDVHIGYANDSGESAAALAVSCDLEGKVLDNIEIKLQEAGWNKWNEVKTTLRLESGINTIAIKWDGKGVFNVDYIDVIKK